MIHSARTTAVAILAICLSAGSAANASTYLFNFNSNQLHVGNNSTNHTSNPILNYMNSVFLAPGPNQCLTCAVTSVDGAVVDQYYTGEGYATGKPSNGSYAPVTLGTSEGFVYNQTTAPTAGPSNDMWLSNTTESSNHSGAYGPTGSYYSDHIYLSFGGLQITHISFDFEIFPDAVSGTNTNNPPDFEFRAGTTGNPAVDALVASFGTNGIAYGLAPGTTANGFEYKHSPRSGAGKEYNQQLIGTFSADLNNVTSLEFIDWPATIGIDNLVITTTTTFHQNPTPEPISFVLMGAGLVTIGILRRRRA